MSPLPHTMLSKSQQYMRRWYPAEARGCLRKLTESKIGLISDGGESILGKYRIVHFGFRACLPHTMLFKSQQYMRRW